MFQYIGSHLGKMHFEKIKILSKEAQKSEELKPC